MFLNTAAKLGEQSGVKFVNGIIKFSSIKLNVHCFETDGVLIDTGSHTLQKQFVPFFNNLNVNKIVITHFHEDHTGGCALLQQRLKVPILMDNLMIERCKRKADYPLYRRIFWGKRTPFHAKPLHDTFSSNNSTWDVIKTPGHSEDHVAFLNRQTGQLFSGDLYVHPKTKLILRNESIPTIINSLKKLLQYDFEEMFCCHAGYINNGPKALSKKLNYLTDLQGNILNYYNKGLNSKEINKIIFKKTYPITYFSLGEWSSLNIVNSVINEAGT